MRSTAASGLTVSVGGHESELYADTGPRRETLVREIRGTLVTGEKHLLA